MKKKGWLVPLILLAALLCGTVSAQAASSGWQKSGDDWKWYDSSGSYVTNVWKKGGDNDWRYLNGDGVMATNAWVDNDDYYVDDDGKMLTNCFKQLPGYDDSANEYWYYFNSTGKVARDTWKKVDSKWYHLGDTGRVEYGWILENMYYTDENGVMVTGWQKLKDPDDDSTEDTKTNYPGDSTTNDENVHWYYFSSTGKKYVPLDVSDGDYGERKVDGKRYSFDTNGARQYGWVNIKGTSGVDQAITDYRYYNSDGSIRTGWYSLNPPEDLSSNYSADVVWFYFKSTGEPEAAEHADYYTKSDFVKINGNTYLFNSYGTPVYGLQKVYIGTYDGGKYTSFYFGKSSQCCVQKGKFNIKESDGTTYSYYFSETDGSGYTGTRDSYLYYLGKPQKANKDVKYEVISLPNNTASSAFTNYVVNTSGKLEKKTTVKDRDGVKLTSDSGGVLVKVDGESVESGGFYNAAVEPDYAGMEE